MSTNKIVKCRVCGKPLSLNPETENIEWILRSKGYYYHKGCWDEYMDIYADKTDEEWLDLIFYLITHGLHCGTYNYQQIARQCENMVRNGKTMKGIYFACRWIFLIEKKTFEPKYGLGLIPYVYEDACNYWVEQEKKKESLQKQIEMKKKLETAPAKVIIQSKPKKAKKPTAEPVI